MLTALLLLLGLTGAGAGLYTILREPRETPAKDSPTPSQPSSTRASTFPKSQPKGGEAPPDDSPTQKRTPPLPQFTKAPKITYPADEIITKNSKYSHFRRPLLNAEALVEKIKIPEAIEIYQKTKSKIPDPTIQEKIETNIQDLKKFQSSKEELEDLWEGKTSPITGPIPLKDLAEAVKEIAEALAESLSRGFYPPQPSGATPTPKTPPEEERSYPPPRKLPPGYFPPPIVYQIQPYPEFRAEYIPPTPVPEAYSPPPQKEPSYPTQEEPTYPTQVAPTAKEKEPPKEEDIWSLDLPEDTFFTKEWEKFKDLPLTDRRSGRDRRQNKDRRSGPSRKDRRSGEDRRKVDLFKEREEYLRKKAEEKKKLREEGQKFPEHLEENLQPYWPPPTPILPPAELVKIGLPDPQDIHLTSLKPSDTNLFPTPVEYKIQPKEGKEYELPNPIESKTQKKISPEPQLPEPTLPQEPRRIPEEIPPATYVEEELPKINLPDPIDLKVGEEPPLVGPGSTTPKEDWEDKEPPEIEFVDENLEDKLGEIETPETPEVPEEKEPEKIIHGVLELKPPEVDDAPFLTLTYDFSKIPDSFRLSKNYSIMEYSYYKYKPMLMKAQEFARRKMLKNALNYYRVIKAQNIPPEMRKMINRNIQDITEFMEKFLMAKGG